MFDNLNTQFYTFFFACTSHHASVRTSLGRQRRDAHLSGVRPRDAHRFEVLQQQRQPRFGGFVLLEAGGERAVPQLVRQALAEGLAGSRIVGQSQVAPDHVLQQSCGRFLGQRDDHFTQNDRHVREPIVRVADVGQPAVVQQNLLQNERRHSFAQLRTGLHDAQA